MSEQGVTTAMVKAIVEELIKGKVIASHDMPEGYLRVWESVERGLRAALHAAPWCEHGISDGEYCQPCNAEYKRARLENGPDADVTT